MVRSSASPADSSSTGVFVETVTSDDSEDDERTIADERLSETSSVGSVSLTGVDIPLGDMIDLTGDDRCRVYMMRTLEGQKVYCCCGSNKADCGRRNHQTKSNEPVHRAPPRFYEGLPNTGARYRDVVDGRLDRLKVGLTRDEMAEWRDSEAAELERVTGLLADVDISDGESLNTEERSNGLPEGVTPLREVVDAMEEGLDREVETIRQVTFGATDYANTPQAHNLRSESGGTRHPESRDGSQDPDLTPATTISLTAPKTRCPRLNGRRRPNVPQWMPSSTAAVQRKAGPTAAVQPTMRMLLHQHLHR